MCGDWTSGTNRENARALRRRPTAGPALRKRRGSCNEGTINGLTVRCSLNGRRLEGCGMCAPAPTTGRTAWLLLVADGAVRGGGRDEPGRHGGAGRGRADREAVGPRRTPRPPRRRRCLCLGRRGDLAPGAGTRTPRDQPDDEHGRIVRRYRSAGRAGAAGAAKAAPGLTRTPPKTAGGGKHLLALAVSG